MATRRQSDTRLSEHDSAVLEAATLVHRKFGTSKRFAESDKRDIAEILMSGLTSHRERCQLEIESLENRLETARIENKVKRTLQANVSSQVIDFAKSQGRRLESHAHDMTTTSELLLHLAECPDKEQLQFCLENILEKTSKVLPSMESMCYEKEKCLQLLSVPSTVGHNVSLVDVLRSRKDIFEVDGNRLDNRDEVIENLARDAEELVDIVDECREEFFALDRKMTEADDEIERLRNQLGLK